VELIATAESEVATECLGGAYPTVIADEGIQDGATVR
jgi:hypothetical protein